MDIQTACVFKCVHIYNMHQKQQKNINLHEFVSVCSAFLAFCHRTDKHVLLTSGQQCRAERRKSISGENGL